MQICTFHGIPLKRCLGLDLTSIVWGKKHDFYVHVSKFCAIPANFSWVFDPTIQIIWGGSYMTFCADLNFPGICKEKYFGSLVYVCVCLCV